MDLAKRGLKNRIPIANAIRADLHSKLCEVSESTKIAKSKILDAALEKYFNDIEKEGVK